MQSRTLGVLMGALAIVTAFSSRSFAHDRDHGSPTNECRTETLSQSVSGPASYHSAYTNINHTNVTIQNFDVRTEEGDGIHVPTSALQVDLQALAGFAQGLTLDLTSVDFPGGASEIHIAEIETQVTGSGAQIQSIDGTSCSLSSLPKKLNLYTGSAVTAGHDAYHVKVGYTALNSIQLDVITTVTQTTCCARDAHHRAKCRPGEGHGGGSSCTSKQSTSVTNSCKLVNRRQPINSIVRAIDDAF